MIGGCMITRSLSDRLVSTGAAGVVAFSLLTGTSAAFPQEALRESESRASVSLRDVPIPVDCVRMADENVGSWAPFRTTYIRVCEATAAGDVEALLRMCSQQCGSKMKAIFRKDWSKRSFRVQMLRSMNTEPAGADVQSFPLIQNLEWDELDALTRQQVAKALRLKVPSNPPAGYVPNYSGPVVQFLYGPSEYTFAGTMKFRQVVNGQVCSRPDYPSLKCA